MEVYGYNSHIVSDGNIAIGILQLPIYASIMIQWIYGGYIMDINQPQWEYHGKKWGDNQTVGIQDMGSVMGIDCPFRWWFPDEKVALECGFDGGYAPRFCQVKVWLRHFMAVCVCMSDAKRICVASVVIRHSNQFPANWMVRIENWPLEASLPVSGYITGGPTGGLDR